MAGRTLASTTGTHPSLHLQDEACSPGRPVWREGRRCVEGGEVCVRGGGVCEGRRCVWGVCEGRCV